MLVAITDIKAVFTDTPYLVSFDFRFVPRKVGKKWERITNVFRSHIKKSTVKCLASCILIELNLQDESQRSIFRHSFVIAKIKKDSK